MSLTTSPIFWAAAASASISPSVACASVTATRTTLLVSSSWRPISPIEVASSSAAMAAVLTLDEASLEACTAPSACCEVSPEELESVPAVDFMACALSPTVFSRLLTSRRNVAIASSTVARRFSSAAISSRSFSICRRSVMSWCVPTQPPSAIGVLMTAMYPSGPGLDHVARGLAPADRRNETRPVVGSIAGQRTHCDPLLQDVLKRAARLHGVGRKAVHLDVAPVEQAQTLGAVVHAQALRHVIEGGGELPVLPAQAVAHDRQNEREPEDAGEGDPQPACEASREPTISDIVSAPKARREYSRLQLP